MGETTGIGWTCIDCNDALTPANQVEAERRLCKPCKNARTRARYQPKGPPDHYGPLAKPGRDGDKQQARARVNQQVKHGLRAHPNTLPCFDCGHVWREGERRHEYDHHRGYSAEHQLDVQAVCTTCHARRDNPKTTATSCGRGHAYTEENTIRKGDGARTCRECRRARDRERVRPPGYWQRINANRRKAVA